MSSYPGAPLPRLSGILRTDNSSSPRKREPRACPWHEQGGKRLKSLGSRFRGNDEQRGAKVGCAELDYSLESGNPEAPRPLKPGPGSGPPPFAGVTKV